MDTCARQRPYSQEYHTGVCISDISQQITKDDKEAVSDPFFFVLPETMGSYTICYNLWKLPISSHSLSAQGQCRLSSVLYRSVFLVYCTWCNSIYNIQQYIHLPQKSFYVFDPVVETQYNT